MRGANLAVTSLNKIYWPPYGGNSAITKRDYLTYLAKVSDFILPHLRNRMLTLRRFPNGITGNRFYQKHWEQRLPPFVETARSYTEQNRKDEDFLLCNNLLTLMWLGNIGDLEIHTSQTRVNAEPDTKLSQDMTGSVANIERSVGNFPDYMVLDLDPYLYSGSEKKGAEPELHSKGFDKAREMAFALKEHLDTLHLNSFIKTSGKTGLHIYVPIKRNIDYDSVREVSRVICAHLLKEHPREVTMEWATQRRTGKVFLDHNMNARSKSLVSIYSPRVVESALVSTPVEWSELNTIYPTDFDMFSVPDRLFRIGDIWHSILNFQTDLSEAFGDVSPESRPKHHGRNRTSA